MIILCCFALQFSTSQCLSHQSHNTKSISQSQTNKKNINYSPKQPPPAAASPLSTSLFSSSSATSSPSRRRTGLLFFSALTLNTSTNSLNALSLSRRFFINTSLTSAGVICRTP
ncbi:hypothetical protein HanIR_Chr05g0216821 [Helianthus annuus]|nr:hypothetical protein HanIR_Chr05g0216821 [Helianthus annuus]